MIKLSLCFPSSLILFLWLATLNLSLSCKQRIDAQTDPDPGIAQPPQTQPKADAPPQPPSPLQTQPSPRLVDVKFAEVKPEGIHKWDPKWNTHITEAIEAYGIGLVDGPDQPLSDIGKLCKGYGVATQKQKASFWALFFASFARYESGFDTKKRYRENASLNYVYSEGLLQLSYGDEKNHANCPVSKSKSNIHNARVNLQCGVAIMVNQLKKCQCLFTAKSYYWSVLTNKKTAIAQDFKSAAGQLGFCN